MFLGEVGFLFIVVYFKLFFCFSYMLNDGCVG